MSDYSRRQFLHDSLLAAAAAGAAGPVGKLLGAEATTAASIVERGPNEKLRFAVCGVHGQGSEHIKNLLNSMNKGDADIVAICDVDEHVGQAKCDDVAKSTGNRPKFYQDVRKLLEDKDIDCVSAAVPNHWHALLAIWAMQAGKDVYTEKPAAYNMFECQRMVETARAHKRICQIGTQSRSMPGTIDAIQFIRDGKVGEVNLARGICFKERMSIGPAGEYPVPANIDYDLWRGPAPMAQTSPYRGKMVRGKPDSVHYDWHWNWLFGNGDLGNQGIHEMDVAAWGLGVTELAKGVIAYGGRFGYTDAGETPNTEVAVLDFGPKTLVFEMHGLTYTPFKKLKGVDIGIVFEGSEGYVALTSYTGGSAFDKDGKQIQRFSGGRYEMHHANFIKAVRSRNPEDLNCDVAKGALSASLVHMANISYRLGQPTPTAEIVKRLDAVKMSDNAKDVLDRTVAHLAENNVQIDDDKTLFQCGQYLTFDPKLQMFSGNAKANELMTREYRKGFEITAGKA
jgi:predicted dehydrogenase